MKSIREILKEVMEDTLKPGQIKEKGELPLDSADAQIDGILLALKAEVLSNIKSVNENKDINSSFANMSLIGILNEEEEIDKEDLVSGSEDVKDIGLTKSEKVNINADSFARHVREFVDTYEQRLDIRSVIVNRAMNIIKDKHPDAEEKFKEALDDVGLGTDPRYKDAEDESFQPGATGGGGA